MRVGTNPNRSAGAHQWTDIVLSVVTHLPNTEGYHARRLEVVQLCLESMRAGAGGDYTIIIWDNGSCSELRDWLQYSYKPDVLIMADNMGKTLARDAIAHMLPPDKILTYSDDDIYYSPNWLQPQIELMNHYPNVSCVTGYPVRTSFRWGNENTVKRMGKRGKITEGRHIPEEWERDFCVSIGRDYGWHKNYTAADIDILCEYKGVEAYLTSHHCQFITTAGMLSKASKLDGQAMGDEKPLDIAFDKLGNRLATTQRLTRHIGNVIDSDLRQELIKSK